MNFRSWPHEFRSTKLRRSKREVLIFFFFFFSLPLFHSTVFKIKKNGRDSLPNDIFSPFILWIRGSCRATCPSCSSPFLSQNNLFHHSSCSNYLIRTFFKLLPNFQDFLRKSRFLGSIGTLITSKNVKILTISEFDEIQPGN